MTKRSRPGKIEGKNVTGRWNSKCGSPERGTSFAQEQRKGQCGRNKMRTGEGVTRWRDRKGPDNASPGGKLELYSQWLTYRRILSGGEMRSLSPMREGVEVGSRHRGRKTSFLQLPQRVGELNAA